MLNQFCYRALDTNLDNMVFRAKKKFEFRTLTINPRKRIDGKTNNLIGIVLTYYGEGKNDHNFEFIHFLLIIYDYPSKIVVKNYLR